LVTTLGISDVVIVETGDVVLVAHKDRAQDVKTLVESLQKQNRCEVQDHPRVYRPWGSYEGIDRENRFEVKRIIVNPGAKLSLQKHFHRAEHWVVVSGTAHVTRDNQTFLVSENESIYIPLGALHSLANPGRIPLHLIEVQSGAYLGEDDIIRVEDTYGRVDEPAQDATVEALRVFHRRRSDAGAGVVKADVAMVTSHDEAMPNDMGLEENFPRPLSNGQQPGSSGVGESA
jgi:mannose-1-phosphate guanylyltransferase/mannose-6-phosphate isomerase